MVREDRKEKNNHNKQTNKRHRRTPHFKRPLLGIATPLSPLLPRITKPTKATATLPTSNGPPFPPPQRATSRVTQRAKCGTSASSFWMVKSCGWRYGCVDMCMYMYMGGVVLCICICICVYAYGWG